MEVDSIDGTTPRRTRSSTGKPFEGAVYRKPTVPSSAAGTKRVSRKPAPKVAWAGEFVQEAPDSVADRAAAARTHSREKQGNLVDGLGSQRGTDRSCADDLLLDDASDSEEASWICPDKLKPDDRSTRLQK